MPPLSLYCTKINLKEKAESNEHPIAKHFRMMLLCAVKQKPSSWVFIQKSKLAVDIEKEPQVFPTLKKQACFCSASGEAFSPFSMVGSGFLGKMFLSVPTTWLRNRMEDRMKNGWKEAKSWMLTWKLKKLRHQFLELRSVALCDKFTFLRSCLQKVP